jgi:hypothetical protein
MEFLEQAKALAKQEDCIEGMETLERSDIWSGFESTWLAAAGLGFASSTAVAIFSSEVGYFRFARDSGAI